MGLVTLTAPGTIVTGTGAGGGAVSIAAIAAAATVDSLCRLSTSGVPGPHSSSVAIWGIDTNGLFAAAIKLQLVWDNDGSAGLGNVRVRLTAPGFGAFVTNFIAASTLPSFVLVRALYANGTQIVSLYDGATGAQLDDNTTGHSTQFDGALATTGGVGVVSLNANAVGSTVTQQFDGLALYTASLGTITAPYTHVPVSGDANIAFLINFPNTGSSGTIAEVVGGGNATATASDFAYASGGTWNAAAPASVTVSPTSATLGSLTASPNTVQLTPTVKDSGSNVIPGAPVTYASNATGVATVNSSGLVTYVAPGSATITVTATGGSSPTATCAVTCQAVSVVTTVAVTPATPTIASGGTQQMAATSKDQFGVTMSDAYTWTSGTPADGTVNSTGLVSWVAAGTSTITATSTTDATKSGNTVATFSAASTPTTVTVSPNPGVVPVGSTLQLTAVVDDQNGHVMTGQTVSWSSSNTAAMTVNSAGLVTWVAAGTATITATDGSASGTAALTATTETYDFSSSNPAVCTVDALGRYTLVSHGTAVITITRHGTAISTTVTVTSN